MHVEFLFTRLPVSQNQSGTATKTRPNLKHGYKCYLSSNYPYGKYLPDMPIETSTPKWRRTNNTYLLADRPLYGPFSQGRFLGSGNVGQHIVQCRPLREYAISCPKNWMNWKVSYLSR